VIAIDWSIGAAENYLNAVDNVRILGFKIGNYIIKNAIDPRKIHCIGHSLGIICFFYYSFNSTFWIV
jgi:hypothetical protein